MTDAELSECEQIGHHFVYPYDACRTCGTELPTALTVGERVYNPKLLPVGAVISCPSCGPMVITGSDKEYLFTTECWCKENKIRLEAAAWRCGDMFLESLPGPGAKT